MADLQSTFAAGEQKFVSFLKEAGEKFEQGVAVVFPAVLNVAEIAEPVIDLALPAYGPLYNTCVSAAILAEQAAAAAIKSGATVTGAQKFANVLAVVGPMLTAQLQKNGVTGDAATASITSYINAIVGLLNGPLAKA